jgi:hypothetical protein
MIFPTHLMHLNVVHNLQVDKSSCEIQNKNQILQVTICQNLARQQNIFVFQCDYLNISNNLENNLYIFYYL